MTYSEEQFMERVETMDKIVSVCFAQPGDEEIPQTFSDETLMIDLIHRRTGILPDVIESSLHHQITE